MEKAPRLATDVLLELETKLDIALNIIRAQDLNIKILSNKLNLIIAALDKITSEPTTTPAAPKYSVESVNTARPVFQQPPIPVSEKELLFSSEENLPVEDSPKGFRRTSRPETFAGDDMYLPQAARDVKPKNQTPKPPPGRSLNAEVIVPPSAQKSTTPQTPPKIQNIVQNAIPVMQRIVDKAGKSIFLADVELIDLSTMQSIYKTRTNGTGKWMASLGMGNYRVMIRKGASSTKDKIDIGQDIQVDGTTSPLELQTMIIK